MASSKIIQFKENDLESLNLQQIKIESKYQKDKWTFKLILACLTASIGTFQFGYNLSSLNPATIPIQAFIRNHVFILNPKNIINETLLYNNGTNSNMIATTEAKTVTLIWTLINSIFVVGQIMGGFFSKYTLECMGRKNSFLFNQLFCLIASALVMAALFLNSPICLMISRFFFGLLGGFFLSITPIYLSEIPPNSLRGAAGSFAQVFISFGIVTAQLLGFRQIFGNDNYWHFLLAFPIVPGVLSFIVFLLFLPESPKALLIKNKDYEKAKKALCVLRNTRDVKAELDNIYQESLQSQETTSFKDLLSSKDMRWPLITTVTIYIGLQFSGIIAIFFYSASIFKNAGIAQKGIQYAILLTGLTNIPANFAAMPLIEKYGRRPLELITILLVIINFAVLTTLLTFQTSHWIIPYLCIASILFFITMFSLGFGLIPSVYATEVFAQSARGTSMAFVNMVGCLAFFLVAFAFPLLQPIMNQFVFLIFPALLAVVFLILYKKMPETKGRSVDEIVASFKR